MFNNIIPGQPISVAQMKALADMVERSRGALTHGQIGQAITPGGTAPAPQIADFFTAKITEATGTGLLRIYSITEVNTRPKDLPSGATTRVMDKTSGRVAVKESQPARSIDPDAVYQEDDLVLVRRNVADVNEFEILLLLGRPSSSTSTGGCSGKLGWLLDTASLTLSDHTRSILPRAMAVAVLESEGRCSCIAAPAGDSAALRFFDALDNPDSEYHDNPFAALEPKTGDHQLIAKWNGSTKWEMLGTLAACCSGCMTATFEINGAATLLLARPVFTVTIYGGCKASTDTDPDNPPPKTFTMWAECGNDGYVVLSGFDTQACQYDPVGECINLFRIGLVCVPCRLATPDCKYCKEGIGPAWWKLTEGSRIRWMRQTGECTWEDDCGEADVSINCDTLRVTTEDAVYESTSTVGFNCIATHTISKVSGDAGAPASVTLAAFLCSTATGADLGALTVSTDVAVTCQFGGSGGSALSAAAMSMDGLNANYTQGGGLTSDPCDDVGSQRNSCKGWGFGLTYLGENQFLIYPYCNTAETTCGPGAGSCYSGPSAASVVENSATYPDVLLDFDIVVDDAACDDAPRTIGTTVTNM